MPHNTQWMANSDTSVQATQSCTSPPKSCIIIPNIDHRKADPIVSSSFSKPSSTSSGNDRTLGIRTELSDSNELAPLDLTQSTTRSLDTRSTSSKLPVLIDHVPNSSIQANQLYAIIPPSKISVPQDRIHPLVPSKSHNQIEAGRSVDRVADPSSKGTIAVPEFVLLLPKADKVPSRTTKAKKSSASKAAATGKVRRSTRKNYLPLGPRHLEWEYHDAHIELQEATSQAVYEIGYDFSRVKAGKSILRDTRPTVDEVMRMGHPAVLRARKRVNEADKKLHDALARGFTWENTPLPTYEVVKDKEGNVVEATMIEDPLDVVERLVGKPELPVKRGSKRKHEQEAEEEDMGLVTRKRRVTKAERQLTN